MNFNTVEEACAEIVRLQEQVTTLTTERDALSQNNAALTGELESVRKLNQQYFNKLSQQFIPQENENGDSDEEVLSCEDFAKTLNII